MTFAGIYNNELSVINVFPSIQCFGLNISEMNRIESTSYSVLITRGISRYDSIYFNYDHRSPAQIIQIFSSASNVQQRIIPESCMG